MRNIRSTAIKERSSTRKIGFRRRRLRFHQAVDPFRWNNLCSQVSPVGGHCEQPGMRLQKYPPAKEEGQEDRDYKVIILNLKHCDGVFGLGLYS